VGRRKARTEERKVDAVGIVKRHNFSGTPEN